MKWYHYIIGCVLLLALVSPLWGQAIGMISQRYDVPYVVGLYIVTAPWLILGIVTLFFLAKMD